MTIETDQLVLRPWEDGDAAELYALASDPEIGPACGWAPHASERESLEVIRHVLRVPESYAVIDRRTGELLGAAALKGPGTSRLAASRHEFELGYWIGRQFWGYGYATEAAEALVRRAITELGATLIWGACEAGNVRSRAVLEACGLEPTGTGLGVTGHRPGDKARDLQVLLREIRRTLFIDADACPVTREALECARRAGWPVVIAGNTTQNLERHIGRGDPRSAKDARGGFWVDVLDVSVGADSADFAIVERLAAGDVVVTQDIGLASMVLGRDAAAISVRGHVFRPETIDMELLVRHEEKKERRAGGRTRGPAAFTAEDRRHFSRNLARLLRGGE